MASGWFGIGLLNVENGGIDLDTTTLKLMLVDDTYTFDPDQLAIDNGTVDDALSHEIVATSYTGGWGGSGRKTATVTLTQNTASNRVDGAIADLTWSSIGGATNDTIGGAILMKSGSSDDTTSIPICFFDVTDTPTNGGSITLDFTALGSGGNFRIAY